jgi:hypothetical protein
MLAMGYHPSYFGQLPVSFHLQGFHHRQATLLAKLGADELDRVSRRYPRRPKIGPMFLF